MWVPAARAALRSARTFAEPSINIARSYKTVSTPNAPSAIGPYSQAVIHNGTVYVSGCIPFDPQTMQCVEGGIEAQAQRALDNLFAVVKASGSEPSKVLKTTVFLKDMNDFTKVNAIYEKAFAPYKPARSAVEVARLPRDVLVEVECIAATSE
ncbi:organonitrogen compound deaminase [Malassezia pachydermatis]